MAAAGRRDVVADAEDEIAVDVEVQAGAAHVARAVGCSDRRGSRGEPAILTLGTRRITRSEPATDRVPCSLSVKRLIWL